MSDANGEKGPLRLRRPKPRRRVKLTDVCPLDCPVPGHREPKFGGSDARNRSRFLLRRRDANGGTGTQ